MLCPPAGASASVRGGAGGIDKPFDTSIARCNEHVQKAVDIIGVGVDGIVDAAWHTAQGRFVQNHVAPGHHFAAGVEVAYITFYKSEIVAAQKVFDIMFESSGEVVETGHLHAFRHEIVA